MTQLSQKQTEQVQEVLARIQEHCRRELGIVVTTPSMLKLKRAVAARIAELGVLVDYALTVITYDNQPGVLDVRIHSVQDNKKSSKKP